MSEASISDEYKLACFRVGVCTIYMYSTSKYTVFLLNSDQNWGEFSIIHIMELFVKYRKFMQNTDNLRQENSMKFLVIIQVVAEVT